MCPASGDNKKGDRRGHLVRLGQSRQRIGLGGGLPGLRVQRARPPGILARIAGHHGIGRGARACKLDCEALDQRLERGLGRGGCRKGRLRREAVGHETGDGDDAAVRPARQVRQRRRRQFEKRGRHDGEGALEVFARQLGETAPVGKPRGMDDRIDVAELLARRGNEPRCRPGIGQIAAAPRDLGAGALALRGDRFQPLDPCGVGALPMQHQAGIGARQPARDRRPDPDPAAGDDGNAHGPNYRSRQRQCKR